MKSPKKEISICDKITVKKKKKKINVNLQRDCHKKKKKKKKRSFLPSINPISVFRFPISAWRYWVAWPRKLVKWQVNMWVFWMHLLEGCDELHSTHMLPEALERPPLTPQHNTQKLKAFVQFFWIRIWNSFWNDAKTSRNTARVNTLPTR